MGASREAERASIRPVKESVEDELLSRSGVVAVDIGEKVSGGKPTGEQSIVVFVESKKPTSRVAKKDMVPAEIDGIKTDVQELVIELQSAVRFEEVSLQVDPAAYPTLSGGIGMGPARTVYLVPPDVPSAGNYVFVGTLGAIVRDRASGATMAITNFHVACVDSTWAVGNQMVQPSRVDGGAATGTFGPLTRAQLTENTDGAVITIDTTRPTDPSIVGIGDVAGTAAATVGLPVQKRGRTTEHTFGSVTSTDATVSIDYGDGLGVRTLRRQIRIATDTSRSTRFSDHGDSGSVVVDNSRNVVGLLFAGSADGSTTFANPIGVALDELGVDIVVRRKSVLTRPAICDTVITRPATCTVLTRTAVCNVFTRPQVCFTVTKPAVCTVVTRPELCNVTRPELCEIVTAPGQCDFVTRSAGCLVTRAVCGPGGFDPTGPITRRSDGVEDAGAYGDGADPLDDAYVAGYLAALEAVAAEEEADDEAGA